MFPEERYSFASFTWARSALASRCFAETHLEKFLGGGEVVPEDRVIVGSKDGFVMFGLSLVVTIRLLGYPILTRTHMFHSYITDLTFYDT